MISAAFALLLVVCVTTASFGAAGSADDPLVSLAYLEGTFKPAVAREAGELVKTAFDEVWSKAAARIDGAPPDGYSFAARYTAVSLPAGKSVRLTMGSGFLLTSGAASLTVTRGAVVNLATGAEVKTGAALTKNQRYFCAEDTAATVTAAAAAAGLVDGYYITDGAVTKRHDVFSDVKTTDWFYDAVDYVYKSALFSGTAADKFSPASPMTRGMFVTALHRLDGKPAATGDVRFSDVRDASQYYYDAVYWAAASGVVNGYGDGTFRPNASVTREQMAAIMYRYAAFKGVDVTASDVSAYDAFSDKASVSAYAQDALRWATARRVINGADGKLNPSGTAPRAQVAQIVLNFRTVIG
jgi:hypothetical protein